MVKAAELGELDLEELESRLGEAKQELFNMRFQLATGQLDNVARIGQLRRDVARMLTLLRQREIEAAETFWAGQDAMRREATTVSGNAKPVADAGDDDAKGEGQ